MLLCVSAMLFTLVYNLCFMVFYLRSTSKIPVYDSEEEANFVRDSGYVRK